LISFSENAVFARLFFPAASFRFSIARSRWCTFSQCLILLRARDDLTTPNQSRLGLCPGWVITSTMSPECSLWRSGTMRPLTFAPVQLCPTSV